MDSMQIIILCFVVFLFYLLKSNYEKERMNLPPGPKPLPIIGNILEIGQNPHESLAKLSKIYGPLMSLKLGRITTIVISSPDTAKIFFQKYDQIFSSRTHPDAICVLDHHKISVAWMPTDNKWRKIRRLCKEEMFSVPRLDASQGLRMEKLRNLSDYVNKCCISGQVVDIGQAAFTTSLNLISTTLFSMDFADIASDASHGLTGVVRGIMELIGKPNVADYFPILRLADPQGISGKMETYFNKCFDIFDEIINQRQKSRATGSESKNDFLEALLELNQKNEDELSLNDIKHLLLDLFVAGIDTSSGTVEWAMTELMRNPEKMIKAKSELRNVIQLNKRVQESDISKLPYMRAVVKETFRFHPTVPLLVPRKADKDIQVDGHVVPKNSKILVNVWAIGRDSSVWSNPESFMPERFLEQETEFWGQHFELIPFGSGRRICLGLSLANRMVHLMLATFIHTFDWELEQGHEEIDTSGKFGLSLQKKVPLKAIPSLFRE